MVLWPIRAHVLFELFIKVQLHMPTSLNASMKFEKTLKKPSSQNWKEARRDPEHDIISLWILEADKHVV